MKELFYEIQKAVLIPLRTYIDNTEKMPTEEVWQVVGRGLKEGEAKTRIQYFRTINPKRYYRLMVAIGENDSLHSTKNGEK